MCQFLDITTIHRETRAYHLFIHHWCLHNYSRSRTILKPFKKKGAAQFVHAHSQVHGHTTKHPLSCRFLSPWNRTTISLWTIDHSMSHSKTISLPFSSHPSGFFRDSFGMVWGECWENVGRMLGGWWEDVGRMLGGWWEDVGRRMGREWEESS